MEINIAIITFASLLFLTGVVGAVKKSITPFNFVKILSGILGVVSFVVFLISSYSPRFSIIIIGVISVFIGSILGGKLAIKIVRASRHHDEFHNHSYRRAPYNRESSSESHKAGFATTGFLLIIGIIMYLVFSKYLDFKMQSNSNSDIAEISLMLATFCFLLCITTWAIANVFKRLSKSNTVIVAHGFKFQSGVSKSLIDGLIVKGKLFEALNKLEVIANENKDVTNCKAITLIRMNLYELEKTHNSGLITAEQNQVEKSRLSEKILNLANEMNEGYYL